MNRRPPNDQDYDNDDMMHDHAHDENDDFDTDFNDDTAEPDNNDIEDMSSPIGRLMDDDVGFENEPSAYVSGYDRQEQQQDAEKSPTTRRRRERPDATASHMADHNDSRETRRRPRPESRQESRPEPRARSIQDLAPDDDFYEAGIREARRRRPPNPDPRPAVRAAVPTPRRMSAPPPRAQAEQNEADRNQSPPPEDSYDTFRQRYRGDLISAGASRSAGGERSAGRRQPATHGEARGAQARSSQDSDDAANLLRVGIFGGVLLFLVIFIILIVQINRLSNSNSDAQYTIANMEEENARYHAAAADRDAHYAEIRRQEAEINRLNNELTALQNQDLTDGQGTSDGTISDNQTDAEPEPDWPRTHVVLGGQSLGRIATIFYGANTLYLVEHIQRYNNIANANHIQEGDVLIIPAPPPMQ